MSTKFKSALAKVEKVLGAVVGTQKIAFLEPAAFLKYAQDEIKKAQGESVAKAHARLSLLYKSVLYSSNIIEDETADSIKVPVFVADQTTLAMQENDLYTPDAAAKMNPSSGTVFEQGFVAKMLARIAEIQKDVEADAAKAADEEDEEEPPPSEGDETEKAKKKPPMPPQPPGEEDDTEKAKGKQPPPFPPPKKGDDDETEKAKGKPPFPPPPKKDDEEGDGADKSATKKSLDAAWPDDMNDPSFIQKGVPSENEWGED